ncbi:hypothetical protein Goklo_002847, partial [Gossypium klotzschianum]|nr:hypothetical protein [Gossypium klotzschianum]
MGCYSFYSGHIHERMVDNIQNNYSLGLGGIDWACIFGMISWCIGKNFITSKPPFHKSHPFFATSPLARDSICLNIDGSIKVKEYIASVGVLVQDSNGVWMFGFCRYLGCCSVLDVELWAILDGLHLALDQGVKCILIQIDSLEAVNAIQQLLTKVHYWCIQHIPREENKIANALAKMVRDRRPGVRILNNPPLR